MDTQTAIENQAARNALEDAIRERLRYRRWYRANGFTLDWPTRWQNEIQLRELVRVARLARHAAGPAAERADPVTVAQAYADAVASDHFRYPGSPA